MPDGNAVTDKSSEVKSVESTPTEPSELEKLISEAETQQLPATDQHIVSTAFAVCTHEGTVPHDRHFCKSCSALMCVHCAASLDPGYCVKCLQENNFKPLV